MMYQCVKQSFVQTQDEAQRQQQLKDGKEYTQVQMNIYTLISSSYNHCIFKSILIKTFIFTVARIKGIITLILPPGKPSDGVLASSAGGPGFNPQSRTRLTKDVIKMVPVPPLFSTEHSKGKILALANELR